MKKIITIIVLLATITVSAQGNKKHHNNKKAEFTPEQQAILKTKKMTLALDLNKSQQDKILKINEELAKDRAAKKAEMKANRAAGKKLTDLENFNLKNANLDERIAVKNQMREILSKEQFEKWEKHQHKFAKQKMHKEKMNKQKKHHKMKKGHHKMKASKLTPATPVAPN